MRMTHKQVIEAAFYEFKRTQCYPNKLKLHPSMMADLRKEPEVLQFWIPESPDKPETYFGLFTEYCSDYSITVYYDRHIAEIYQR